MKINWQRISIKELAAIVTEKLKANGIDSLVVGGACVSIYTENRYLSSDIDIVSHAAMKRISTALSEIGFSRQKSRHFMRNDCPFFIEFVSPPAAIGKEQIQDMNKLPTKFGEVILLTATDCVKDRLAAFFHWNDPQAFEQACMVAASESINIKEIERWARGEGYTDKFRVFRKAING